MLQRGKFPDLRAGSLAFKHKTFSCSIASSSPLGQLSSSSLFSSLVLTVGAVTNLRSLNMRGGSDNKSQVPAGPSVNKGLEATGYAGPGKKQRQTKES